MKKKTRNSKQGKVGTRLEARERSGTDRLQRWRERERAATWERVSARGCEIFFGAQDDKKGIGNRTERAAGDSDAHGGRTWEKWRERSGMRIFWLAEGSKVQQEDRGLISYAELWWDCLQYGTGEGEGR